MNQKDWKLEWFEERAAILEYDAGYPRWEAENRARSECNTVAFNKWKPLVERKNKWIGAQKKF